MQYKLILENHLTKYYLKALNGSVNSLNTGLEHFLCSSIHPFSMQLYPLKGHREFHVVFQENKTCKCSLVNQ